MTTDNINFYRFERDSEANKQARQKSNSPRLTYDFRVEIDGDFRALLLKEIYSKGYRLYDADHRPINDGTYAKHLGEVCDKQDDFFTFIQSRLDRIPTLARMAELRQQEADRKVEIDRQARQNIRDRHASAKGPTLLKVLKHLLATVDEGDPDHETMLENEAENAAAQERNPSILHMKAEAFAMARKAIAAAEDVGEHFERAVENEVWSLSR